MPAIEPIDVGAAALGCFAKGNHADLLVAAIVRRESSRKVQRTARTAANFRLLSRLLSGLAMGQLVGFGGETVHFGLQMDADFGQFGLGGIAGHGNRAGRLRRRPW